MEKWECVEVCPYCGGENILQWNTEKQGFLATCQHCGKKILLCDDCLHSEDNPTRRCDWTEESNGFGYCFRRERK